MNEPLTDERLAEIETLLAEATPGLWHTEFDWSLTVDARPDDGHRNICHMRGRSEEDGRNADLIAASPAVIQELLAEVKRLKVQT